MPYGDRTSPELERIAAAIVDSAYTVHRALGPGLLESAYAACLTHELRKRGFRVDREVSVPVTYDGVLVDCGFQVDLLIDHLVVVELKAVLDMHPVFKAQTFTYLKLMGLRLGFLINFNVNFIKDGIERVLQGYR